MYLCSKFILVDHVEDNPMQNHHNQFQFLLSIKLGLNMEVTKPQLCITGVIIYGLLESCFQQNCYKSTSYPLLILSHIMTSCSVHVIYYDFWWQLSMCTKHTVYYEIKMWFIPTIHVYKSELLAVIGEQYCHGEGTQ